MHMSLQEQSDYERKRFDRLEMKFDKLVKEVEKLKGAKEDE